MRDGFIDRGPTGVRDVVLPGHTALLQPMDSHVGRQFLITLRHVVIGPAVDYPNGGA